MTKTTASYSERSGSHTFYKSTKKDIQKNLRYAAKNAVILGRMDGWDELAVAAATVLPAYARPAFLTATLGILSFPVSWGAQGMAAEFQEMKDDVQGLKNKRVDLALKLLASKHTPQDIKQTIKEELKAKFDDYNENNQRHLEGLNRVKQNIDTVTDETEKATEIKNTFKKLDIKFDDSDDKIEELLKKENPKGANYTTVKQARDLITQYKEANREGKTALTEKIQDFLNPKPANTDNTDNTDKTDNKGTLDITENDWNWTKDKKITKALQKIADDILIPKRNAYINNLFTDYHTELHNKEQLKEALDEETQDTTKINDLLNELKIDSYETINNDGSKSVNHDKINSDILQYKRNEKEIKIEQNPITGYLGNAAMVGMTVGTALSAAKAGTQLLGQFGVLPNLMPALTAGLELAGNRTFVASQTAMVAYGLGQAFKGMEKNNLLENDRNLLLRSFDISDTKPINETQKEQLAHIEQLQHYNTRKNTVYGLGIAAAEAGMIAGNLTGSSPLLMAAALGTLACAGLRMWTQSAESALTGDAHDHEHNGEPITLLYNLFKDPEIERAVDSTTVCGDANCKTDHGDFELNEGKLNTSQEKTLNGLALALKELGHIVSNNFDTSSVKIAKTLYIKLVPSEQKSYKEERVKKQQPTFGNWTDNSATGTTMFTANQESSQKEEKETVEIYYTSQEIYINSILDNPTALENAKEILIDRFEDKGGDDHKKDLQTLKTKRPDVEALKKLFTDNLAELDKPQNAQKILKPLLQERIEKLTAKKHHQIQNMVHLQKIRERKKEKVSES